MHVDVECPLWASGSLFLLPCLLLKGNLTSVLCTVIQASLEEVDTELVLVQEELQKVWGMLKTRDTELEEQHLELESARSQVQNLPRM